MTKKHLIALAATVRSTKPAGANRYANPRTKHIALGRMQQWLDTVYALAAMCAAQNERFDYARFLDACGAPPVEKK